MLSEVSEAIVARLSRYDRAVEVGVGNRTEVAEALAADGVEVVATDVHERSVPAGVSFAREDVTTPDPARYRDADVVYACNCPPELQRPLREAARLGGAECLFTTLGTDPAVIPADRESLSGGETLYRARMTGPGTRATAGGGR